MNRSLYVRHAMMAMITSCGVAVGGWTAAAVALTTEPYQQAWVAQTGSAGYDIALGASADACGVYIVGRTLADIGGPSLGGEDAFLVKYDLSGQLSWIHQFGTASHDRASAVAGDNLGNVYAIGTFQSQTPNGFVNKYDSQGNQLWSQGLSAWQMLAAKTSSAGDLWVAGSTLGVVAGTKSFGGADAFVVKYSAAGGVLWATQCGTTASEIVTGLATGPQNLYVVGTTSGSFYGSAAGSDDVFVQKYDAAGNLAWGRQIGSPAREMDGCVAADAQGNVYVGCTKVIDFNTQAVDLLLTKFSPDGDLLWSKQWGSTTYDYFRGLEVDALGNVLVLASTFGRLADKHYGGWDGCLLALNPNGDAVWGRQFGCDYSDSPYGMGFDGLGNVYIGGATNGSYARFNPPPAKEDVFALRFDVVPEPSAITSLGALTLVLLGSVAIRRRIKRAAKHWVPDTRLT